MLGFWKSEPHYAYKSYAYKKECNEYNIYNERFMVFNLIDNIVFTLV